MLSLHRILEPYAFDFYFFLVRSWINTCNTKCAILKFVSSYFEVNKSCKGQQKLWKGQYKEWLNLTHDLLNSTLSDILP